MTEIYLALILFTAGPADHEADQACYAEVRCTQGQGCKLKPKACQITPEQAHAAKVVGIFGSGEPTSCQLRGKSLTCDFQF